MGDRVATLTATLITMNNRLVDNGELATPITRTLVIAVGALELANTLLHTPPTEA
jgi:hypothetical protein